MRLFVTSPSFTAAMRLVEALAERGVTASVAEWGKTPHTEPQADDHWIVLAPAELPAFAPLPKCEFGQIDVDAPLETQIAMVLQDLEWTVTAAAPAALAIPGEAALSVDCGSATRARTAAGLP